MTATAAATPTIRSDEIESRSLAHREKSARPTTTWDSKTPAHLPPSEPCGLIEALRSSVVVTLATGTEVISEVQRRTGHRFNSIQHAEAARQLGARPPRGEDDRTTNLRFVEYIASFKRYLYSQAWIDELVRELHDPENFERITGTPPKPTGA